MARNIPALVKPELLVWARQSAGFPSLDGVAEMVGVDALTLQEWERGHELPSIGQLRKLGEIYHRPIAVFFLAEPPRHFDAQREFRRLPGTSSANASPALLLALRWAFFRREAAIELHRLTGQTPSQSNEMLHPSMDREEGGRRLRELLGVSWRVQTGWSTAHAALSGWRTAVEAKGVLVFQTSDVELDEMRATCIPDQPLPVILLNAKDAPQGRVFSLLHEFTHILLDAGGHHTSRMIGLRSPEEQPLEVAANAFTAAALLPEPEFRRVSQAYSLAPEGDENSLKRLARRLKVSPEAILRRMMTLGLTTERVYREKRQLWGARLWYVPSRPSSGGPPVPVRTIAKDGPGYTRLVLDAYDQRIINTNAASDYLDVKPQHFNNLRLQLANRPSPAEV